MGFSERFSLQRLGVVRDKVMAGGTPANPATLNELASGDSVLALDEAGYDRVGQVNVLLFVGRVDQVVWKVG
jgi:hypothetical protein